VAGGAARPSRLALLGLRGKGRAAVRGILQANPRLSLLLPLPLGVLLTPRGSDVSYHTCFFACSAGTRAAFVLSADHFCSSLVFFCERSSLKQRLRSARGLYVTLADEHRYLSATSHLIDACAAFKGRATTRPSLSPSDDISHLSSPTFSSPLHQADGRFDVALLVFPCSSTFPYTTRPYACLCGNDPKAPAALVFASGFFFCLFFE